MTRWQLTTRYIFSQNMTLAIVVNDQQKLRSNSSKRQWLSMVDPMLLQYPRFAGTAVTNGQENHLHRRLEEGKASQKLKRSRHEIKGSFYWLLMWNQEKTRKKSDCLVASFYKRQLLLWWRAELEWTECRKERTKRRRKMQRERERERWWWWLVKQRNGGFVKRRRNRRESEVTGMDRREIVL